MRDKTLIESVESALMKLSGMKVAILIHSGGDPDSIGAAYVLSNILKSLMRCEPLFRIPSDPSTHSVAFLNRLGISQSDEIESAEAYLILDCGSPEQLGDLEHILESGKKIIVVDHHSTSVESFRGKAEIYVSDKYSSVCELVFDLANHLGYELSTREREALFAGIYYDTVRLSVADSEALRKLCALASNHVNPRELLQGLEIKMDLSERIARLKAAARIKIYRVGDWLIAVSRLSSFQSSSARSLVSLGAHVAMVGGESEDGITVSFRALRDFIEATGINLGKDIAARIGAEFGGHGGGHSSAAKAYCVKGSVEEILRRCVELIGEKLGEKPKELQL